MASKEPSQARPGNSSAEIHGGEAAVKSLQHGTALTGPARDAEAQVYQQLAQSGGRVSLVTQNAARLQAAADLYWNALVEAGESGDLAALDRYVARFGWLAGCSLRAWAQVKQEQADDDDSGIIDAIASARGNNGNS